MKLATVRKLEGHFTALFKAVEKDGSPEAKALKADYEKTMMGWYRRRKGMELAAAERKDKGVVLFTVFLPDKNSIREVVRTPHRMGAKYHWRRGWPVTTHFESGETHWDTSTNFYTPEMDFRRLMRPAQEVAA